MLYDEFCQNEVDYDAREYYEEVFNFKEGKERKLMFDFMDGILESIYETGDVSCLTACVEELAFLIDPSIKIPEGKVKLERKRK